MPRAKKRSVLKDKSNIRNAVDKEFMEKTAKVTEVYRNWLAGAESQQKMLEQIFDNYQAKKLREVDELIFRLPPELANMTVEEFLESGCPSHSQEEDMIESGKVVATVKKEITSTVESMETDNIVCTVDQALLDLQQDTTGVPEAESREKPARKKTKKAPATARKKKKNQPGNQVMETPLNTGTAPVTWKDTPFISLSQRHGVEASRYLTPDEARTAVFKLVCLTGGGDQVMCVPRSAALREDLEMTIRDLQQRIRRDAFGHH